MTCTSKTGAASAAGASSYAIYLVLVAAEYDQLVAARYYAGPEIEGQDRPQNAVDLCPNLSAEFATRLGIDTTKPLSVSQMAHLMNNRRADGKEIEGKKRHSAHQSVASVFGLDTKTMPSADELINVLSGKRADGKAPRAETGNGGPLPDERVQSSLRAFKAALGIPADREATQEEIIRTAEGRIDKDDYRRQISITAPPIGYVDLTFSADKSVSIAFALAPSQAERDIILSVVKGATEEAMAYALTVIGVARRGAGGQGEAERAELAYFHVPHYTSRPAAEIVRQDADGRNFTDTRQVPSAPADPQLHRHVIVFSSVLADSGRIGSIDLMRLNGERKVMGAVFHAALATRLQNAGIKTELGPNGEARISGVQPGLRKFFSRRSTQGEIAAREYAKGEGLDWNALTGEQKAGLINAGAAKERKAKDKGAERTNDEGPMDLRGWKLDAHAAGFRHRLIIGKPDPGFTGRTEEQRIQIAREVSLPLLEQAFKTRAVLTGGEMREIAARGLIVSGIGPDANADINAITRTYREQGIGINGQKTNLVWSVEYDAKGRKQVTVTTGHTIDQERTLTGLVRDLAADKSQALTPEQIDQAAERFLAAHPKIDRDGDQWKAQLKMAHDIGAGGRFTFSIGVAGSGKTSAVVAILVEALHAEGKMVYGLTVPWKASAALKDAGVDQAVAIAAFIKRVETGKITVDKNTVIVIDEVSQVGIAHQIALTQMAQRTGAKLIEIGDPRQCQAVETPAIDLIAAAIGDATIPKLLTSIRQETERGREVAGMFRDGRAVDGLAAMQEDGRVHVVAGSREQVIRQTTELWRQKTEANKTDPDYSLLVMTPSNAQARDIGTAIRADRRQRGEIGRAETVVKAYDPNSKETFDLALSVGDKIRTFTRTRDAESRAYLSANGDVVTITKLQDDGLRVRNEAGMEGLVTWAQMKPWRAPKNDPVRITYGYAVTIDTAQSLTRSAAIVAMPDGSSQVTGYKAYTGLSRHVADAELVISDAAERRDLKGKQMLGAGHTPTAAEVIHTVGVNLSRFPAKSQASTVTQKAATHGKTWTDAEREQARKTAYQRARTPMQSQAQAAQRRSVEQPTITHDLGLGHGFSR